MKPNMPTKNDDIQTTTNTGNTTKPAGVKNKEGISNAKNSTFEKLFIDMLADAYWAEKYMVKALQNMSDAASTEQLQNSFEDHLYITQKHAARLEKIFGMLGKTPTEKKSDPVEMLVKEAEKIIQNTNANTMTRDAGLIFAVQKIEHYEIASYHSLAQVALTLGYNQIANILEKTLREEEDANFQLKEIAEIEVNPLLDDEEPGYEINAGNKEIIQPS